MAGLSDDRDGEMSMVFGHVLEGADAALAQHDVAVPARS